jgi:hypothetical protein
VACEQQQLPCVHATHPCVMRACAIGRKEFLLRSPSEDLLDGLHPGSWWWQCQQVEFRKPWALHVFEVFAVCSVAWMAVLRLLSLGGESVVLPGVA